MPRAVPIASQSLRSLLACLLAAIGCATPPPGAPGPPLVFPDETFAFANELLSAYEMGPDGRLQMVPRDVPAEYGQNCVSMARAVRVFHAHARFDPSLPRANEETYRRLIEAILARDPRQKRPVFDRFVIPGYANLYEFSQGEEVLLKLSVDDRLVGYFQRGNWRMIMAFSRSHQSTMAKRFVDNVRRGEAPVVHIIRFPNIDINHMIVIYDVEETRDAIFFDFYDPNYPGDRLRMRYDRSERSFEFPQNDFFAGGPVRAYEVYDGVFF